MTSLVQKYTFFTVNICVLPAIGAEFSEDTVGVPNKSFLLLLIVENQCMILLIVHVTVL